MKRRPVNPVPRWLRPKLTPSQVRDISLAHNVNLDAIARGEADEQTLWQCYGGVLTWHHVAKQLQRGQADMAEQLQLLVAVIERYGRTGKILFTGTEYQLAKRGVLVMDELASLVDRAGAAEAAEWSERQVEATARYQAAVRHVEAA